VLIFPAELTDFVKILAEPGFSRRHASFEPAPAGEIQPRKGLSQLSQPCGAVNLS
jgi:hypothetical protein